MRSLKECKERCVQNGKERGAQSCLRVTTFSTEFFCKGTNRGKVGTRFYLATLKLFKSTNRLCAISGCFFSSWPALFPLSKTSTLSFFLPSGPTVWRFELHVTWHLTLSLDSTISGYWRPAVLLFLYFCFAVMCASILITRCQRKSTKKRAIAHLCYRVEGYSWTKCRGKLLFKQPKCMHPQLSL